MLEESLQPTIARGDPRRSGPLAGDVAEMDGAGADHADDEKAECLDAALAEPDLGS
jgi:hypothetical protein